MGIKKRETIKSMTGFGKGTAGAGEDKITAEIKTLNHRNLSISCASFEGAFLSEERIKDIISQKVHRGKVFARINREESRGKRKKITINEPLVKRYISEIKAIKKKYKIRGEIDIKTLFSLPGIVCEDEKGREEEKIWPVIKKATEEAVKALIKYREEEGGKLARDVKQRLQKIKSEITKISKEGKKAVKEYRVRLAKKIEEATANKNIDKIKIEEEVAIFARNSDIAEEIVRLTNHVEASLEVLMKPRADVGKKLDFIAQEMHREINTIGAKAGGYKISNMVIEIKSEVEKIREQLSNIE